MGHELLRKSKRSKVLSFATPVTSITRNVEGKKVPPSRPGPRTRKRAAGRLDPVASACHPAPDYDLVKDSSLKRRLVSVVAAVPAVDPIAADFVLDLFLISSAM
jgi:hypothetical protein